MQDPRALASLKNLDSYAAWSREAVRRSGFGPIIAVAMALAPLPSLASLLFRPSTGDARAWVVLAGAAGALFLATALGLMLLAVLRLKAWRRANPWTPPPRPSWK